MANSDKNIRITPNKGTTSFPKIVFTGQANDPITVNVLDDNSLSFSGSAGQLFSLSNNISSGTIFSVNDISGFPSFRINANGTVSANEFSGNFGIGISNPYYKLQVIGTLGVSGGVALTAGIASTSSSSGTLVVTGGAAIGSSLSVGGSLLLWNGTNYSALKYTGSNNITYTLPTALPGSGTSVLSSDTSGILSWVPMTATGVGGGGAGTVYSSAANLLAYYPSAGAAVTGNTNISVSGTGLTIGFTTSSTGTTTGALTVAGGVGIGGSLYVNSPSSVSGVNFNNGIVTSGTWAGSTVTAYYGGTGYTNYTKGDLLVGLGTTLYKLPVGTQGQLLQAFSTATAGVAWTSIMPPTYGAFYSMTTQQVAGAGITTPITVSSTFEAYNTQILGGSGTSSRIQIQTAGTYNIQFSAQINLTLGASNSKGDFWFRINGTDVPKSNTEMSIAGKDQQTVLSLNFVSSFLANDYFEVVMASDDIHYAIQSLSGLTSPPRPDVPSFIVTVVPVTQVVGSSVGIGVSGLVSLNGLNSYIQYFATGQSGSDFNISSSGFTHTFNIPIAGTASTGLITSQAQTIGGAKTFTSPIIGNLTGIATTATNINSVFATTNASHPLLFTPTSGTASGVAVSTNATLNFNPSTSILNISGLAITSGLASTSSTSGALIVTGGVGIGGSINASLGGVIGGVTITSGTLYGNLTGVATTATYSNQAGYAITSGSSSIATTATYSHQAGYAITSGTAALATTATYAHQSGYSITSGSAGFWITPRTLNLSGDLSGSVVWSGSGDTTLTATIVANAVALGTDTTGQYASTIAISGSGITATAANADDGTAYTIYSSATSNNTASSIVLRDGSGNFSAGTITANLTGTASTATYAHQSGYAITSGSSSTATTATYSHQSGYAITSGSSALATTASNINVVTASNNIYNPVLFSPQGTGTGVAVSSYPSFSFNPTANILNVSGLAVTSSLASTSTSTGAFVVTGGVGIGDSLNVATIIAVNSGVNGLLLQKAVGASLGAIYSANVTPSTSNYSFAIDGNNLNLNSTGSIFFNNSNTVRATLSANNFAVNINVASTSTSTGALTVSGGVGIGGSLYTGTAFPDSISGVVLSNGFITSGTWAGSTITAYYGGTGIQAGSFVTGSLLAAGSLTTWLSINPGTSGYFLVSNGTSVLPTYQNPALLTVGLATTSTYAHQAGYGITAGSAALATTATYSHQAGYAITSGSSSTASTATYSHQAGYAITSGSSNSSSIATTATNINVVLAGNNIYNPILFSPQGTGSGVALSSYPSFTFNPTANILNVSGLAVTSTTVSTSTSSGALIVNGGVGIGGSLYTLSTLNSSISGVNHLNGVITSGSWAGSAITAFYGGTGIQAGSLITGSLLAAGSLTTWLSINPGTNGYFLVSNGTSVLPSYQNPALLSIGLATTATYAHQSGYAITSGSASVATTSYNVNVASGTAGSIYFVGVGASNGSGLALSSAYPVYYNFSPSQLTAPFFYSTNSVGDEGGEIVLNKAVTNTTLSTSVTIDIFQNKIRFFETGGTNRGFYLDISTGGVSAATNIMGGSSSGTVNTGVQNQVAYYAANGNAVSGTSNLQVTGTGVTVGFTTVSTSSSTGALTVAGGAGIAGSVYIAGEVRIGTNTFTKNYSGDINLDNGTADTPGVRYYWQNNKNFGNDVYYSGSGSTRWRVVKEMGETGGAELFSVDREGVVYINNPGSGVVSFKHTGSGSATYTFPNTAPATGTSVLQSDTTGVLSWVPMTAGGSGSGSVNNSAANLVAYYPTAGTAVTGNTSVSISGTGLSIGFLTNAADVNTGALTIAGGAGIAGTLWANTIGVGGSITYTGTNVLGTFSSSVNSYNQVIIQNKSNGSAASADFVLNNNLSTDSTYYGNLGINSSGFTGSGSFSLANAVYLSSTTGDLVIGSTTANIIRFVYNSGSTDTMQITGTGVSILSTSASGSTNTGALVVAGGAGFGASVNIFGNLNFSSSNFGGTNLPYIPKINFVGTANTTISLSVLTDNSLSFDSTSGQLFSVNNSLSTGYIYSVNDISGIPLIRANANGYITMAEYGGSVGIGTSGPINKFYVNGSAGIFGTTTITAPDTTNKALRVLGFSSSTQGDILSFEHPAGGSFIMNGNFGGQAGGRFTIIASGNASVRAATFAIQASDTKTVLNVDATSGAGALSLQNATNLQLFNSTNAQYAGFKYTGSATTTYTLPASAPGAGVSVLQSDTAGVMSWVAMAAAGGGSGTVTTLTAGTGITFSTGTTITTTGTIRAKRPLNLAFCSGYTPAASGADTVILRIPSSPTDGTTSLTYKPQQFFVRVETASATASTVQLEKYTGTSAFSGTAITSIGISGASTYELSTNAFAAAGTLLTSGDKLRINFTALSASHANFSVYLLLEEV